MQVLHKVSPQRVLNRPLQRLVFQELTESCQMAARRVTIGGIFEEPRDRSIQIFGRLLFAQECRGTGVDDRRVGL